MRRIPPLNAVRAFEAAARHESFTKAAEELCVTPPAVGQQVKLLEEWLGKRLFERLNRGLVLTPAGQAYLPVLSSLFDRLESTTNLISGLPESNALSVCVTPGFAALWLGPRLWSFANAHPELDIRVSAYARPLEGELRNIDIAIPYGEGNYRGYKTELLLKDGLTPVCAPSLLNGPHPLKEPSDLRHHTLLHNESAVVAGFNASWQDWLDAVGEHEVNPHRGLHFSDLHLVMQEAIAGRGVGLGHLALVGEELRSGRLVRPLDCVLPARGDYYIAYRPSAERAERIEVFLEWLRRHAAEDNIPWGRPQPVTD